MRQQMEAERRRRATVSDSEGTAQSTVTIAQAERQAAILRAEGQAKALTAIAEAEAGYLAKLSAETSPELAAQILLAQKCLEGFHTISRNPGDKVFLPNSPAGLMSLQLVDHTERTPALKPVLR
jgi:regulator of protease activity HflC (stomatin/prohibitin superfamily)